MYQWEKLGHLFNPQTINDSHDRPWMKAYSQCTSSLVFDDFVRIYFSCRPDKSLDGEFVSNTAFVDLDRKNLFKILKVAEQPILPLGGLGSFDEFGVYPTSVIRDKDKVLLYYAGWSREKSVPFNTSIGMAVSEDDGITFKRTAPGPIIGHSQTEPFVVSGPKVRKFNNSWWMHYLAGTEWIEHDGRPEIVYKIKAATSTDGIIWNKLNKNIINDILEPTECQAGPDIFFYEEKYHMYFVYRYAFDFRNNKHRGYRIGYAYSTDLVSWTRDDVNVGIEYSKTGWDSTMHHYPHVFELDGTYYMLYNGNEFGKYGFGLAKMVK